MKLASFDLEIAKEVEGDDWAGQRPLGIACAGSLSTRDGDVASWSFEWKGVPQLSAEACRDIVEKLILLTKSGYTIVTVNGLGFDFAILAEESGMVSECADLALNCHCDLMLMIVCYHGWPVGLDALADGANRKGKLHDVVLNDGSTVVIEMNGSMAPRLWAAHEYHAVLSYLKEDIRATLETAVTAVERGYLSWKSQKGRSWAVNLIEQGRTDDGKPICRLPLAAECLAWPRPDTSWMTNPLDADHLSRWAIQATS